LFNIGYRGDFGFKAKEFTGGKNSGLSAGTFLQFLLSLEIASATFCMFCMLLQNHMSLPLHSNLKSINSASLLVMAYAPTLFPPTTITLLPSVPALGRGFITGSG